MQIKQLEALVNVIDFGSFSKAAEATYLSQPTISSHIRTLEREVGMKLVVRSTKEIYPSHAGKVLYEYAKEIIKLRERAMLDLRQESSEISGTLQIAVSDFPSQYFLPAFLEKFSPQYPELKYRISNYQPGDVADAILDSQAEIGITESGVSKRNLVFTEIADESCVIILPDTEEFRELLKEKVGIERILRNYPYILCNDGAVLYQYTMRYINSLGMERRDLKIFASMQNVNSVVECVRRGLGISIIPRQYVEQMKDILILSDSSVLLRRTFYLTHHASKPLSPAAEAFAEGLKAQYGKKMENLAERT